MKGPIDVLDVWLARDGGIISIRFTDADGKLFEVCRDKRLDFSPHYTYIGGMYPTDQNASKIENGSEIEEKLTNLLNQWVLKSEKLLSKISKELRDINPANKYSKSLSNCAM